MATCLYAGTTILQIGATSTTFAYNSYVGVAVGSNWSYTPWYTKNGYWMKGSSLTNSTNFPSTLTVNTSSFLATSKNGTLNVKAQAGECFTITVTAGANGSASGGGTVLQGGSVSISATANTHYKLSHWSDGDETAARTLTNIQADATLTATFVQNMWALAIRTENSTKGTVATVGGWTSGNFFEAGTKKSAKAVPKDSYELLGWYLPGAQTPAYDSLTPDLLMLAQTTDYTAKFLKTGYTLTLTATAGGAVSSSPAAGTVKMGTTVTATVTQVNWGYDFVQWTGTGVANSTLLQYPPFVMPSANVTLAASFVAWAKHILTLTRAGFVQQNGHIKVTYLVSGGGLQTNIGAANVAPAVYRLTSVTVEAYSTDTTLCHFIGWYTDAACTVLYSATGVKSFTMPNAAFSLWAKFGETARHSISANVSDGGDYVSGNDAEDAGCTATVTTPANAPEGEYLSGTSVSIGAAAAQGWTLTGWKIVYADTSSAVISASNPLILAIDQDLVLTARYQVTKFTTSLLVDAASLTALAGTVALKQLVDGEDVARANPYQTPYGATMKAVATPAATFAFEGWYKNGVKIPNATASYEFTVIEATTLTAKFSANIMLGASLLSGSAGSVRFVDAAGATVAPAGTRAVTVGDTYYVTHTVLNDETFFRGYFTEVEGEAGDVPIFTEQTSAIVAGVCTHTMDVNAKFDIDDTDLVSLRMTNDPEGVENTGWGALSATGAVAELSEAEFEALYPVTPGSLGELPGRNRYYRFDRGAVAALMVTPLTVRSFKRWKFRTMDVVDGAFEWGAEVTLSASAAAELFMYRDLSVRAEWVSGLPVRVALFYTSDSNSTMGELKLDPPGANRQEVEGLGVAAEYVANALVTVTALPANGHTFRGWYTTAEAVTLVSAEPTLQLTDFLANVTYYAAFDQDENALYLWEGSTPPKYLTWRSKRLIASVPFDPACVRVFADGYPVKLAIYACSSPQSPAPTVPTKEVTLLNEKGVWVPAARKEKYFEVEVSCPYQVLEIVMSSSMKGLAQ